MRVDGKTMTFWAGGANTPTGPSTASLLKNGDGRCGDWAAFLASVLNAEGVTGAAVSNIAPNTNVVVGLLGPPAGPAGPYVLGLIGNINGNLPAQGNATPKSDFVGAVVAMNGAPPQPQSAGIHAVVQISGINTVFDPSYGARYDAASLAAAQQDWEDAALASWNYRYYTKGGGKTDGPSTNHVKGQRETIFK